MQTPPHRDRTAELLPAFQLLRWYGVALKRQWYQHTRVNPTAQSVVLVEQDIRHAIHATCYAHSMTCTAAKEFRCYTEGAATRRCMHFAVLLTTTEQLPAVVACAGRAVAPSSVRLGSGTQWRPSVVIVGAYS